MSVAVNKWKYRLQYKNYFGGVTTVSRDQFKKINGFANMFYGWGGEDDDLNHRITKFNLTVNRTPAHMARFIMLKHDKVLFDTKNLFYRTFVKKITFISIFLRKVDWYIVSNCEKYQLPQNLVIVNEPVRPLLFTISNNSLYQIW